VGMLAAVLFFPGGLAAAAARVTRWDTMAR